ncbi:MAG: heme exporter protein CcmD [Asticcacaulis sp.]
MHIDLDMGKYGLFVWGSYGATLIALVALTVVSLRTRAERRRKLEALQDAVNGQGQ